MDSGSLLVLHGGAAESGLRGRGAIWRSRNGRAGLRWTRRWSSSCCAGQLIDRLLAEVDEFSGNAAQHDDQTIIVLGVK